MNILVTVAVCGFALVLLWAVQSVVLAFAGEPLALPLRYTTRRPVVRWSSRVMIQLAWLIIVFGIPFMLGMDLHEVVHRAFPRPVPWRSVAIGFLVIFLPFLAAFAFYIKVGWVRIVPRFDAATRRGKLLRRFLTPLPLATAEEAVFRGTILDQLLQWLPQSLAFSVLAVVISALSFSSVHFIRRQPQSKPVWQQAYGFFLAGCLFGVAYIVGGRNLWLPIPVHATAILMIEIERLYCQFTGPRWLTGFAESPYSGLIGNVAVVGMAIALVILV
jgi:uncharacterized membrane protein YidH (DUF202 family)